METLRIFLACPSDVKAECQELQALIPGLQRELDIHIELLLGREAVFVANHSPERSILEQLGSPRDCDLVVVIVWGRLGTFLNPAEFGLNAHGNPYTGTEWEFQEALRAAEETGAGRPAVILYRGIAPRPRPGEAGPDQDEFDRQSALLAAFDKELRGARGEHLRGTVKYASLDEFRGIIVQHLASQLASALETRASAQAAHATDTGSELLEATTRDYLEWLVSQHERIEVRGVQGPRTGTLSVPLQKVYVALKVDPTNVMERLAAREMFFLQVDEAIEDGAFSFGERQQAVWWAAANAPFADFFSARDAVPPERAKRLHVGEICRLDRRIIILGDPGSGKTTITRWLALVYAVACRDGLSRVAVPIQQLDATATEPDAEFVLGAPLLPVLARVSEYAEDRQRMRERGEGPRPLVEFLGHHSWLRAFPTWTQDAGGRSRGGRIPPEPLHAVILQALREQRALVILDGLDEIPVSSERDEIVDAVAAFARQWMPLSSKTGGNQLIVTSRIAGYHLSPLKEDVAHVTVDPMTDAAVSTFIRQWMLQVATETSAEQPLSKETLTLARANAESLLELLQRPDRKHARELATNPLLASVIATVFYNSEGQLPEQRVELYQAAIDKLIDIWYRRAPDRLRVDVLRHELFDILPTLAAHVHQHKPTGFIEENELFDLLLRELATCRKENPLRPPAQTRADLASLFAVLRDDVGLLAAGGSHIYRFLHLTFQEYLAARGIVIDMTQATREFLRRQGDPRWREPLLMALGYVNWQYPSAMESFVRDLLSSGDPADVFPQTALLVASAIPQMSAVSEPVISMVVRHLIDNYATFYASGRQREGRALIEGSLKALVGGEHGSIVETGCVDAIAATDRSAARVASVATLARNIGLVTTRLADVLVRALPLDHESYDYAVAETLIFLLSPTEAPAADAPQARPRLSSWMPGSLKFRRLLLRRPELVARVKADPGWLRLVACSFGGYGNLSAAASGHQYQTMATYLQLESNDREPYTVIFAERWGRGDTIYNMAVHLDTGYGALKRGWTLKPTLSPEAIYREPVFADEAIRSLQAGQPASDLIPYLKAHLHGAPELRASGEALAAIWALGEDCHEALAEASPAARSALEHIGALATTLRDPVVRAAAHALPDLRVLAGRLPPERWYQMLEAVISAFVQAGADPIATTKLLAHAPEELAPKLVAEELVHRVRGWGDDFVYNARVFADAVNSMKLAPSVYIRALNHSGRTQYGDHPQYAGSWQTDPLAFDSVSSDIPTAVFDLIETLPPAVSLFRSWFLADVLAPIMGAAPPFLVEAKILILGHFRQPLSRRTLIERYAPELIAHPDPWTGLLEEAGQIDDPYYRARALLRLGRRVPGVRECALQQALDAAKHVTGPLRAFEVWERLSHDLPPSAREAALQRCHHHARQVQDPELAAFAWCRLSRLLKHGEHRSALDCALDRITHIRGSVARARVLRLFRRQYRHDRAILDALQSMANEFEDPVDRAFAMDDLGAVLEQHHGQLAAARPDANETWTPVILFARSMALRRDRATRREAVHWAAFAERPSTAAREALCACIGPGLIPCSEFVARSLDRGLEYGLPSEVTPLIERLVRLEPGAEGLVRDWLTSKTRIVAQVGALLLAERHDLAGDTALLVAELLESQSDLLRHRAERVLVQGATTNVTLRSVSTLGVETLVSLTSFAARREPSAPGVALRIHWIMSSLLHDSADALAELCDHAETDGPQSEQAMEIVSRVQWLTEPVWAMLLHRLGSGSDRARRAIICALACTAFKSTRSGESNVKNKKTSDEQDERTHVTLRLTDERWAELWRFIQTAPAALHELDIEVITLEAAIGVIREVLSETSGELGAEQIERATQLLRMHCTTSLGCLAACGTATAALERLEWIGKGGYPSGYTDGHDKAVVLARGLATSHEAANRSWVGFISMWLCALLSKSVMDVRPNFIRSCLLELLAAAADLARDSFRQQVDAEILEPWLAEVVQFHNSFSGREAAMRLLGFLQRGTGTTLVAVKAALRDVLPVQLAAQEAMAQLRRIDQHILPEILDTLYDESAIVAYATAQLLVSLGSNPRIDSRVRVRIVGALSKAALDTRSRRLVHFSYVDARIPDVPELDECFAAALRKVSQVSS